MYLNKSKNRMLFLDKNKSDLSHNNSVSQFKATANFSSLRNDTVRQAKMQSEINSNQPVQRMTSDALKSSASQFFAHDFSDVNIVQQSTDAQNMGALAYAQGRDVHFAPGVLPLQRLSRDQAMVAGHEFAHVVQQAEGRVPVTGTIQGKPLNDNKGLETEADNAGVAFANFLGL